MKQTLKKFIPLPIRRVVRRLFLVKHKPRIRRLVTFYKKGDNVRVLPCCISYNKYGGYCVPLSSFHRPAAQKILSGDVWEAETIEFMSVNAPEGDIVHAGSYFGDFIPALSRSRKSGATVWVFEPNPENFRCAKITIYINELENVQLINAGLGAEKATLPMMIYDEVGKSLGGASRLVAENSDHNANRIIEAKIVSLDAVLPSDRQTAIIQLDVEGSEQPALAGAMKTIKRCMPILILENLPSKEWLNKNIFSLGYRETGRVAGNTILARNSG